MKIGLVCSISSPPRVDWKDIPWPSVPNWRDGARGPRLANKGRGHRIFNCILYRFFPDVARKTFLSPAWPPGGYPIPVDVVHSMERIWDQDIFRASDGITRSRWNCVTQSLREGFQGRNTQEHV